MKNSIKKTVKLATLTSVLFISACGQNPQNINTKNRDNNSDNKEALKHQLNTEIALGALAKPELQTQVDILGDEEINNMQFIEIKKQQSETREKYIKQSLKNKSVAMKSEMSHFQPNLQEKGLFPAVNVSANENYTHSTINPFNLVTENPTSTFSIDVDTASYSNVRRILNQGTFPPSDAVRVEEMINYFSYHYAQPKNGPFSVYTEVGPSPFNAKKHLIHVGIQGENIHESERPAANLVFLVDVSGSMNSANKLGLLKNSLKMLTKKLNDKDSVAIVVYAGAAGVVLEPTNGDNTAKISEALSRLSAGGSTNGGAGIELAYLLAKQSFIKDGINRVILATDGDFNVGTVNQQALKNKIQQQRESGVSLSILGFGRGNLNDALMQELAQNGNGNAFYIDNLNEARKVLVEELSSTLMTIAKDVKIQVEFNPNIVSEYRLIGYETRALRREDFNNDKIDAGDIGAGHTVTAIYEISLKGESNQSVDALRYQQEDNKAEAFFDKSDYSAMSTELVFLKLRYKLPQQDVSKLIEIPIKTDAIKTASQNTSEGSKFSAAVAGFGQLLRGGEHLSTMEFNDIITLAQQSKGQDNHGYRAEFINIVKLADALSEQQSRK